MKRTKFPKPPDNPTPFTRAFNKGYDWLFKTPIYYLNYKAHQTEIEEILWDLTKQYLQDNPSCDLGSKDVREKVIQRISSDAINAICERFPRLDLPRDRFTRQRLLSKISGLVSKWLGIDRPEPELAEDLLREQHDGDGRPVPVEVPWTTDSFELIEIFHDLSKAVTKAERRALRQYSQGEPYDENAYRRAQKKYFQAKKKI